MGERFEESTFSADIATSPKILNQPLLNYAAGLNRQGSGAVHRYTMIELADRFALMNVAFDQEDFRVDECLDFLCKEQ